MRHMRAIGWLTSLAGLFIWIAVLTGAAGWAMASRRSDSGPDGRTAAYERRHAASAKSSRTTSSAVDYLKITTIGPNEISFCLDTFADNGNMCNLAGRAVGSDMGGFTYRAGKDRNECVLQVTKTEEAWVVFDTNGACARRSCGAGADIGKAVFLLKNKAKLIHPCEIEPPEDREAPRSFGEAGRQ